jgi:TPR repeat protein
MKSIALNLFALVLLTSAALAGPLEEGSAAFMAGDYAKALQLWQPLARQGNADAQYNLGLLYHKGWGVARDTKQAHEWYTQAANQGQADAMYNLGVMYISGDGVFRSPRQALPLFEHAAARGHVPAIYNLGVMYAYGFGTGQDAARAVELWTQAANQGSREARAALMQAYEQGLTGLAPDPARAAQWRNPKQ